MDKEGDYIISTIQSNRPLNCDENENDIENDNESENESDNESDKENNKDNKNIKQINSVDSISEDESEEKENDSDENLDEHKDLLTNYMKYQNIIVETKEDEYEGGLKLKIELFLNNPTVKNII